MERRLCRRLPFSSSPSPSAFHALIYAKKRRGARRRDRTPKWIIPTVHEAKQKQKTASAEQKKLLFFGVASFFPIMHRPLSLPFSFCYAAFSLSGEFCAVLCCPKVYFSTRPIHSPPAPCVVAYKKKYIHTYIYI